MFVRISSNDNTHTGIDATGTLLSASEQQKDDIRHALQSLEQNQRIDNESEGAR